MGKDPAFLFYSADFLVDISDLTMEERGQFITLICLQHQKGHLSDKAILLALGTKATNDVLEKFTVDENGLYYNKDKEEEFIKRAEYSKSRSENGSKGGRPKKNIESTEKPYGFEKESICESTEKPSQNHRENENENKNKNINIDLLENGTDLDNKTDNNEKNSIEDKFNKFWQIYPRKVGKGNAKKIFYKIKPSNALFNQIIEAVEMQKNSIDWKKEKGQFIPHPSTWLNQERWQDELPSENNPKETKFKKQGVYL